MLIKCAAEESSTVGGVILTSQSSDKPTIGEVVAVGPGAKGEDGKVKPVNCQAGQQVRVPCLFVLQCLSQDTAVACRLEYPCELSQGAPPYGVETGELLASSLCCCLDCCTCVLTLLVRTTWHIALVVARLVAAVQCHAFSSIFVAHLCPPCTHVA